MISSLEQEITEDQIQIGDIFAGGIVFQINENGINTSRDINV